MLRYDAVIFDLDGTLLNSRDTISPYSIGIINGLVEKEMLLQIIL